MINQIQSITVFYRSPFMVSQFTFEVKDIFLNNFFKIPNKINFALLLQLKICIELPLQEMLARLFIQKPPPVRDWREIWEDPFFSDFRRMKIENFSTSCLWNIMIIPWSRFHQNVFDWGMLLTWKFKTSPNNCSTTNSEIEVKYADRNFIRRVGSVPSLTVKHSNHIVNILNWVIKTKKFLKVGSFDSWNWTNLLLYLQQIVAN